MGSKLRWRALDVCLSRVLCSYLVMVEAGYRIVTDNDVQNLIEELYRLTPYDDVLFLVILLYSRTGDVLQLFYMSDNGELQVLDSFIWNDFAYDRVFRNQHKIYRPGYDWSRAPAILYLVYSTNYYKSKPRMALGSYVSLNTMISRYLNTSVEFRVHRILEHYADITANVFEHSLTEKLPYSFHEAYVLSMFYFY